SRLGEVPLRCGRVCRGYPVAAESGEGYSAAVTPVVTYTIIALNVLVYLVTSAGSGFVASSAEWIARLGFVPAEAFASFPEAVVKALTAMFTHADIFHIFFNMYFLYIFGRAIERALGHLRYIILYVASGFAAIAFHTVYSAVLSPGFLAVPSVGASGAISGVLGAYMLLYPGSRLAACFWLFLLPLCYELYAVYYLLFWFAIQVLEGYMAFGAGVAFFAHAGGFVAGIALLPLIADRERLTMLRIYARARSLFGFIYFLPAPRRGLSSTAKLIYSLLAVGLLIGSALSFQALREGFSLASYDARLAAPTAQGSIEVSDKLLVLVDTARGATHVFEEPTGTITLRAFAASFNERGPGFYNDNLRGRTITLDKPVILRATVPYTVFRDVQVFILVRSIQASYDTNGFLRELHASLQVDAQGLFHRYVDLSLWLASVSEPASALRATAALAVLITLMSLYVVNVLDRELVITPD
ncbi:MAG: rhomboid family intramembrane serine protease, partial [Thermoproteota archaeon]